MEEDIDAWEAEQHKSQMEEDIDAWEAQHQVEYDLLYEMELQDNLLNRRDVKGIQSSSRHLKDVTNDPVSGNRGLIGRKKKRKKTNSPDLSLNKNSKRKKGKPRVINEKEKKKEKDIKLKEGVKLFEYPKANKRPTKGIFLSITSPKGRKVYVDVDIQSKEEILTQTSHEEESNESLFNISVSKIREIVEQEEFERMRIRQKQLYENSKSEIRNQIETQLWVDKFAPTKFTQLLSCEKTNRLVLSWIKDWDPCVFGKPVKPKVQYFPKKKFKTKQVGGMWKDKSNVPSSVEKKSNKKDNKPFHKVLLLCGPPGLGKTTLAHVAARHAGYNPIEINASDDRSFNVFMPKVLNAIEMTSMFGGAPNCLIIDEIDGCKATGEKSAIDALIRVIQATNSDTKKKGGSKKPLSPSGPLRRPIICICNSPYVPGMRELRNIARVIHFPPPLSARLTSRLHQICIKEGISASLPVLSRLVDTNQLDIRSCLNTLQFISREKSVIHQHDVDVGFVGHKDFLKNLFQLWDLIFSIVQTKPGESSATACSRHFTQIFNSVCWHGEKEKILNGCFENYPLVKRHDPNLQKTCSSLDWLGFSDMASSLFKRKGIFGAENNYTAAATLAFHKLCASNHASTPRFSLPKGIWETRKTMQQNKDICDTFISELSPYATGTLTRMNTVQVATELVSLLLVILNPEIQKFNTRYAEEHEKKPLEDLLQIHEAYNITYNYAGSGLQLDPPLNKLTEFLEDYDNVPRNYHELDQAQKRMIMIELGSRKRAQKKGEGSNDTITPVTIVPPQKKTSTPKGTTLIRKDFFGRPIVEKISHSTTLSTQDKHDAHLFYRFNEGFTNAVRRTVLMKDFL